MATQLQLPLVRHKIAEGVYEPTCFDTAAAWAKWLVPYEFKRLQRFVEQCEVNLTTNAEEERAAKRMKASPSPTIDVDDYGTVWERLEIFPEILRSSLLITILSTMEARLKLISEIFYPVFQDSYSKLRKRPGIKDYYHYISHLPGITLDCDEKWAEISEVIEIRNLLVHHNGSLASNDARVAAYIDSKTPLLRAVDGRVIVDAKFLTMTLDLIVQLFESIANASLLAAETIVVDG